MNAIVEPKLAPPGAGLPLPELLIARLLFHYRFATGSREKFNRRLQDERSQIRAFIKGCDAERGARQTLIARLRGLEDSSRNWSVWMTLEHVRIVNESIARVIRALAAGKTPPGQASTAAVKPAPGISIDVIERYEASCEAVLEAARFSDNLNTPQRYRHPWFGPLSAAGWHCLAGGHLGIHRKQIAAILAENQN